jgi:signal peptidase II
MKAIRAVPVSRYGVFFAIAATGCILDLATKAWMFDWLGMPPGRTHWLWEGVFGFQTSLNEGALFGMGQGMVIFFAAVSIVALLGILYWLFWTGAAHDWLLTVSLGSISAGILGNLYDRVGLPGLTWGENSWHTPGEKVYAVRDFILFQAGKFTWPNFNLADSLLVCGAVLLLWHAFRSHKNVAESQPSS